VSTEAVCSDAAEGAAGSRRSERLVGAGGAEAEPPKVAEPPPADLRVTVQLEIERIERIEGVVASGGGTLEDA